MSDFNSLTKEQQAYLMQVAHQTFPAKSLLQEQARIITFQKDNQEQQSYCEYLPDDDSESGQLYRSDEDSDKETQVSSLEIS